MTCGGPYPPNTNYVSASFAASASTNIVVKVNGQIVPCSVVALGGGQFKVKVSAQWVTCPGPIEVFDRTTFLFCDDIAPCS